MGAKRRLQRVQYQTADQTWVRLTLGFKPYIPSMWEGIRMLPPMSVPQPTTEPCRASSVPSPPVDPPGVNSVFLGCTVRPNKGFSVSHHL